MHIIRGKCPARQTHTNSLNLKRHTQLTPHEKIKTYCFFLKRFGFNVTITLNLSQITNQLKNHNQKWKNRITGSKS